MSKAANNDVAKINTEEADDSQSEAPPGQSSISKAVERLKAVSLDAAAERERLPQPLFWSLFNAELNAIKKAKKANRELAEILSKLG